MRLRGGCTQRGSPVLGSCSLKGCAVPIFPIVPTLPGINVRNICNIPEDVKGRFRELFLLTLAILNFPTLNLSKAINVIDTKLLTFNGSHHA